MTEPIDQFPSLSQLLRQALGDALAPDAQTLLDMCADDVIFEFPFRPAGFTERIEGKAALAAYLPTVSTMISIESMNLHRVLVSAKGDTAAIEFSCKGRSNKTEARYDQDYISVLELNNGLITRYRDYWNPLIVLAAIEQSSSNNKGAHHAN